MLAVSLRTFSTWNSVDVFFFFRFARNYFKTLTQHLEMEQTTDETETFAMGAFYNQPFYTTSYDYCVLLFSFCRTLNAKWRKPWQKTRTNTIKRNACAIVCQLENDKPHFYSCFYLFLNFIRLSVFLLLVGKKNEENVRKKLIFLPIFLSIS